MADTFSSFFPELIWEGGVLVLGQPTRPYLIYPLDAHDEPCHFSGCMAIACISFHVRGGISLRVLTAHCLASLVHCNNNQLVCTNLKSLNLRPTCTSMVHLILSKCQLKGMRHVTSSGSQRCTSETCWCEAVSSDWECLANKEG